MLAAHRVQFAQRSGVAVHREQRLHDDQGALLGPVRQLLRDRVDVAVRRHRHAGPRQPRGVDQRRVVQRVGYHQVTAPGQGGDDPEVRQVTGREHKSRFRSGVCGQFGLQLGVQVGGPGDQTRAGRARAPGLHGLDGAGHDLRMPGQSEVVVAGQVDQRGLGTEVGSGGRGARRQTPPQPGGGTFGGPDVQPGEGIWCGAHRIKRLPAGPPRRSVSYRTTPATNGCQNGPVTWRWDTGLMPSMNDLIRERTDLDDTELDWLHLLVSDWQLLADLSFADLVLWVPIRADAARATSPSPRCVRTPDRPATPPTWSAPP